MKKRIICIFLVGLLFNTKVLATSIGTEETQTAMEELSSQSSEILNEFGIESVEDSTSLSFGNVFETVLQLVQDNISGPLKLFGLLVGIAILTALYNLLSESDKNSFSETAGMLCAGAITTSGIVEKIQQVADMLTEGSNFMTAFVPVMSAVTAAGGNTVTATAYNLLLIASSQISLYASTGTITSLLGCYLAVSLVSSVNTSMNLSGLANGIKKVMIWGLGIISTVFVGILSIQGIVGKSVDTVAMKTAKFALSSSIPIVGAALSEALSSVEGSVGILRTTVGTFGIIVGLAIVLPIIINVLLTKLAIEGAGIFAEMIGTVKLCELYRSCGSVMTILIAMILFSFLVLLVSTTVVMLICS